MMSVSETGPRRPAAIVFGLATALAIATVGLAGAFWNPPAGALLLAVFLAVAYGIHRRNAWSAYSGALLLAAAAVRIAMNARLDPAAVALAVLFLGSGAFAMFLAARRMPGIPSPTSRAAWVAFVAVALLSPMVCHAYVISTGSMSPTVLPGDQILVVPLTAAPARGEVVQHRYPVDRAQIFVKRVVAVGGDRVHLRQKQLFVNGTAVNEPYVSHSTEYVDDFRDNFPAEPNLHLYGNWEAELRAHTVNGELVVPAGKYFVLGDNRDNSLDSRYFGFVDRADITGKPVMVYFSSDAPKTTPLLLHPSLIRWSRMFRGMAPKTENR
jgi:signal peptidase I